MPTTPTPPPPPPALRLSPRAVLLSAAVAIAAYALHRLSVLGALLVLPLVLSFVLLAAIAAVITRAIHTDEAGAPTAAARQRAAVRPLAFTSPAAWARVQQRARDEAAGVVFAAVHGLDDPTVAARLDAVLGLIRQSFILPWYSRISPSPAFPDSIEATIRFALGEVGRSAEAVDWPTVVVSRILPIVTEHFQHYRSIEHLSSSIAGASTTTSLPLPLPRVSHPALAPLRNSAPETNLPSIEEHFRDHVTRALKVLLPAKEQTEVVNIIVREVVLGAVLMPVFSMLCDSDFWNRQINEQGGRYLREKKQVSKVLSALSTVPISPVSAKGGTPRRQATASITVQSTTKQFDEFMRSIPKLKTLGEARRLRADVDRELRTARGALKRAAGENEERREKAIRRAERYIHRLERARTHIDRRIVALSGGAPVLSPRTSVYPGISDSPLAGKYKANLYGILSDPSSLAFWLEYMERRGRSHLVQFWLTVEGFKDPLEASGQDLALTLANEDGEPRKGNNDNTIGDDISFLYSTYFSTLDHKINVPSKLVLEIAELSSQTGPLSPQDVKRGKRAVFEAQKAVYDQMDDEDWPAFQKSELYLKAVADLKNNTAPRVNRAARASSHSPLGTPTTQTASLMPPEQRSQRRASDASSPTTQRRPYLVNGNFTPAPVSVAASTSTAAPTFDRPLMRRVPTPESASRPLSPQSSASPLVTTPLILTTPPPPPMIHRRSTHLDLLFGVEDDTAASEERNPLFADDGDDDDEEAVLEAQRIEAIQAALNEIIASDDMTSSQTLVPLVTPPEIDTDPLNSPSASLILEPPEKLPSSSLIIEPSTKHPLAGSKLTSRSAEDLKVPGSGAERPLLGRGKSQQDASAARKRIYRRGSFGDAPNHRQSKSIFDDSLFDEAVETTSILDADLDDKDHDKVRLAAPGDMQLSIDIGRLKSKIHELAEQDAILESLIRQAELTGNQKELKLLRKSQSSLQREQRTAEFQKSQYEQQEEANRLVPGRTRVSIPSTVVVDDEHDMMRQVVRYQVEIRQVGDDGRTLLSWVVLHRYNEFWELDRAIRDWAAHAGNWRLTDDLRNKVVEIPGKRLVPSISSSFVESRRAGLEKYLQSLLTSAPICDGYLLRNFLSLSNGADTSAAHALSNITAQNIVKTLYKTVASSLDDQLVPSMLDLMSQSLQRQISEVAVAGGRVAEPLAGYMPTALKAGVAGVAAPWMKHDARTPSVTVTADHVMGESPELPTASSLPVTMQPLEGESATGSFTTPICDLFIEVFDLKENNWLRRQAIVIILQQILGGTIERKFRDTFRHLTEPESVDRLLGSFQNSMWPGGVRRESTPPRTVEEKHDTRVSAGRKVTALMPDVAANMIGRSNARRAAARMFSALQDQRLNQHLMLCVLDEVFKALFPQGQGR